jgi:hypothetical protein
MSFLSDYRLYTDGTEAHPTYHTFSALVALSSIISRRVWVEQGYFKVYPNLYVVLVGPPGNRKTSAMSISKGLIRELKVIPFSAEASTKEKLVLDMFDQERAIENIRPEWIAQKIYSPMAVIVTELSEFLGANSVGMINFLTTVYDQDFYETRTKNKGDVLVSGPYLNLLACTTPDWITTYLRGDVISGGFSRRAIFVLETGKSGRNPFPQVTPEARLAWSRILDYSQKLLKIHGQFNWEPSARAFYSQWYTTLEMPTDETTIGYFETKHMQLLKISMLLSLSESTDLILKKDHLLFGLELLKLAETNLSRVFSGIGRNELNSAATKVVELLSRLPFSQVVLDGRTLSLQLIPEKKLRGILFSSVNQQEMDGILHHLIDTDKIARITTPGAPGTTTRTLIYLKPTN